ncbi:hypothetical protein [Mesorhizobium sp. M8A.F.Ca.ET.021.01.1.1]|uniref:hypothetical protein n=1 Tax=Mesorhizobium sp. M8A.F.Ca.ET.021.01.1.1 TaxID=2496757 RepID=UPI000FC9DC1E|nr:hypothetical protein [Mesorhizobium sp. M8A.F.Ca.ET.021.01.1.1]RUW50063.1 hypothetical protein EOA36_17345 [Mesorhizobium sp. M8A.F.Ca.ET.021.01.1.1]
MIAALAKAALSPAGKALGALLLAGSLLGGVYAKGRVDGRASLAAQLAGDRITILKDGKAIDNEALAADDPALCALLGGCLQPDAD